MNWYLKFTDAGTTKEFLESLQVDPAVIQYIESNPELSKYLVRYVVKYPRITLQEISQIEVPVHKKQPYSEKEIQAVGGFPEFMRNWMIKNIRKMLATYGVYKDNPKYVDTFNDKVSELKHDRKFDELTDWIERNNIKDLSGYTFEQAIQASDEWHAAVAAEGAGKFYTETNIVFGPKWIDANGKESKEYEGWTVRRIMTQNDLKVESNRMNHCVGDYYSSVENEEIRIYSLRDPDNEPHITIRTDFSGESVEEIQGNSNTDPDRQYKQMIGFWVKNSKDSPTYYMSEDFVYEIKNLFNNYRSVRGAVDEVNEMTSDFYNLEAKIDLYDLESLFDTIYEAESYRNSTYYSSSMSEDLLVDWALNLGDKGIEKLIEITDMARDKVEEDHDIHYYAMEGSGLVMPDEEDYETEEKFKEAMEEYYEEEQKIVDIYYREMFPFNWFNNIYEEIDSALKKRRGITIQEWWKVKESSYINSMYKQSLKFEDIIVLGIEEIYDFRNQNEQGVLLKFKVKNKRTGTISYQLANQLYYGSIVGWKNQQGKRNPNIESIKRTFLEFVKRKVLTTKPDQEVIENVSKQIQDRQEREQRRQDNSPSPEYIDNALHKLKEIFSSSWYDKITSRKKKRKRKKKKINKSLMNPYFIHEQLGLMYNTPSGAAIAETERKIHE